MSITVLNNVYFIISLFLLYSIYSKLYSKCCSFVMLYLLRKPCPENVYSFNFLNSFVNSGSVIRKPLANIFSFHK